MFGNWGVYTTVSRKFHGHTWHIGYCLYLISEVSKADVFLRCRQKSKNGSKKNGRNSSAGFIYAFQGALPHMSVSENGGTQQPLVFLLKIIIFGWFWGYHHLRQHPYFFLPSTECHSRKLGEWVLYDPAWSGSGGALKSLPIQVT